MLGIIRSDYVIVGIACGIPLLVAVLLVVWSRPRKGMPVWLALSLIAVVGTGYGVWVAFRPPTGAQAIAQPTPGGVLVTTPPPTTGVPSSAPCSPSGASLHLAAKNKTYDVSCLAAPPNTPFTVAFTNQDANVSHNFHIFTADPVAVPSAQSLFTGQVVTGPTTVDYQVPGLAPGTFFFHCDIHPTLMHGTFVVP